MSEVSGYVMPDLLGQTNLVSFTLRDPQHAKAYRVEVWAADHDHIIGFHEDFPPAPRHMTELWAVIRGGQLYDDGTLVLIGAPGEHVAFTGGYQGHSRELWLRREA